jgi:hypothetical protein
MTWDKPKSARQWFVLFVPAGICVLSTLAGGLAQPNDGDWIGWAVGGLMIAAVVSLGQSIWLARINASTGDKVSCALVCFAILMAVNGAVSFAGCATAFATLPTVNFH